MSLGFGRPYVWFCGRDTNFGGESLVDHHDMSVPTASRRGLLASGINEVQLPDCTREQTQKQAHFAWRESQLHNSTPEFSQTHQFRLETVVLFSPRPEYLGGRRAKLALESKHSVFNFNTSADFSLALEFNGAK